MRRALVTGATRGIGAALRSELQARGAQVTGTCRNPAAPGWIEFDVTLQDSFSALSQAIGEDPLDLLVCNAGVFLDKGQALDTGYPPDMWSQMFATNVAGVFRTIQILLPNIRRAKGKIAIISSQMASQEHAPGGAYIYRASKAAVLNVGRNIAQDLRGDGIAVGIYHPGWVKTDMGGNAADISAREAATGLADRFEALSLETTGCFQTWDGRTQAF